MKICLINPPNQFGNAPLPHMGIAYIAGMLKETYKEVDIIDCPFQHISSEELQATMKIKEYDVVGITTYFYNFTETFRLVRLLKRMSKKPFIVLGGYYPSLHAQATLETTGVDCVCVGEGEYFFDELVKRLLNNEDWRDLAGVAYIDENGKFIQVPPKPLIEDLNALPMPYVIKEPLYWYPLVSGRGCHGHCTFCSIVDYYKEVPGEKIRKRCPESVVQELKIITEKYKNKIIWMMDDNFFSVLKFDRDWIDRFVQIMKKEKVECKFKIFVRSDEFDKEIIQKLQSVGLWGVVVGVESMVDRQLKLYGKMVTPEDNMNAIQSIEELGLWLDMGFILLDPFTTMDELETNLRFLKDSKFIQIAEPGHELITSLGPLIILEDTPIERHLRSRNILSGSDVGYNFATEEVHIFYTYIQKWNKQVSPLYFNFNQEKMFKYYDTHGSFNEEFIARYKKCLRIDIEYLWQIFCAIKEQRIQEGELDQIIDDYKARFVEILESI